MKIITIENLYDYKLGELMEEIKGDRNVVVSLTTTFSKKFDFFNQKDNIFDSIEEFPTEVSETVKEYYQLITQVYQFSRIPDFSEFIVKDVE